MKILMSVLIIGFALGFASMAMAEEDWWYEVEITVPAYNDGQAGGAEMSGAKYTPQYTAAELKSAKTTADAGKVLQDSSSIVTARAEASAQGDKPGSYRAGVVYSSTQ
jgi:hypothetical protein